MNLGLVEKIANAVLYEGYILYPYRPSAVKNRQRFNFGALYPRAYSEAQRGTDASEMRTECLVEGDDLTAIDVKVRFLHLLAREVGIPLADGYLSGARSRDTVPQLETPDSDYRIVDSLEIDGRIYQSWQEAVEREVSIPELKVCALAAQPQRITFAFPSGRELELLRDERGQVAGAFIRRQNAVEGLVDVSAERVAPEVFKLEVRVSNTTPADSTVRNDRNEALLCSLASTHTILTARAGEFISLLDPPEGYVNLVASCRNVGTWPVLVGDEGERSLVLSSPIILYDYPQVAPESAGELYDSTEIDEILTLRIMTLTDQEKREMRNGDERARRILERTETLPPEQLMKLHGALRGLRPVGEGER